MDQDKRFGWPHVREIMRLREKKGWTLSELADGAGLSVATVKRIEDRDSLEQRQRRVFHALGKALDVEPRSLYFESAGEANKALLGYVWKDIECGAKNVAAQIVSEEQKFDAILTFPAASSIFCGLVLRSMPLNVSLGMPVYVGFFAEKTADFESMKGSYFSQDCDLFKILLPKELTLRGFKKIVVIEDCIITGRVMDKVKAFFSRNPDFPKIKFACCICSESRGRINWLTPDIIGLEPLEKRDRFELPWGEAYCYEDVFERRMND